MKIILTGTTGYIGTEVLRQAIADPAITRIYTLTRKPLATTYAKHDKVSAIIHEDFAVYDEELLSKMRGAEACIWMIGIPFPKTDPRPIDVGFTQAASAAFTTHLQPYIPPRSSSTATDSSKPRRFKFIYLSGAASVADPEAALWYNAEGRLSRGEAENAIAAFAQGRGKDKYQAFVLRPGLVIRWGWMAVSRGFTIPLVQLAGVLLGIAKGSVGERDVDSQTVNNGVILEWAKELVHG